MGYMMVYGACFGCKRFFHFSAARVPSIPIDGEREPVCGVCVERVNPTRLANGLDPIVVMEGAYEADEC